MKRFPILGVLLLLGLGAFSFADAQVVSQQPLSDVEITTFTTTIFRLGSGINAPIGISEIGTTMRQTSNSPGFNIRIQIFCRTSDNYAGQACAEMGDGGSSAVYTSTVYPSTATTTYSLPVVNGTNVQFLPNRFYFIQWQYVSGSGGTLRVAGTNTIDGHVSGSAPTPDPSMPQYYLVAPQFEWNIGTSTRIVQQISPYNGATTDSTNVSFSFTWFNNTSESTIYEKAQIEISDVTSATQYVPLQEDILSSGYGTTTISKTLIEGHMHIWRACLFDTDLGQKICGPYYSFNVVSPSAPQSLLPVPNIDGSNATSSLSQYLTQFINIPYLLSTKYPFSYFYDIGALLIELQSTTTQAWPEARFDYDTLNISTTSKNALPDSFVLFSSTTVTEYIPENVLSTWRALMAGVLWFGFAFMVFRRTSHAFH